MADYRGDFTYAPSLPQAPCCSLKYTLTDSCNRLMIQVHPTRSNIMSVNPNHHREDIEEQFELPDMPPRMTANRAKDVKRPCDKCEISECRCIGWKAFDVVN